MCKKRLFTRSLHYNYDGHANTIFTLCLDEIQGSKKSSGTWLHLARLHSGNINHFNYTSAEKIGVNKTANSENIFKTGHLIYSNMGDLPFDLSCHSEINTRQLLIWLSFVGIHVSLLSFALLTYPQVEEVRVLNLEASARGIIRTAGVFLKFDPPRI